MSDWDDKTGGLTWRLTRAQPGESVRWESAKGEWVTISLGGSVESGKPIVAHSSGKRQTAESFEHALTLAKRWRE
jgi:hypothetical protein